MGKINTVQISGTSYSIEDSGATKVLNVTQAEYDALPTTAKTANILYNITDAQGGDLTNYYTKTEVDNAITAATATKQDTLVSGTNIKTINNESLLGSGNIDIQGGGGGGKAIEGGRGITVTTGATADTVSFNLPISAGTGEASAVFGKDFGSDMFLSAYTPYVLTKNSFAFGSASISGSDNSFATGYLTKVKGGGGTNGNFAQGYMTTASGNRCHSEGLGTSATADASHSEGYETVASGNYSHSEGENVNATNQCEHSQGRYNVSNKANGNFGDSGNTLFSVGNGTADNARHNAFEIRQNGDIYLTKDGQDVKLQDHLGGGSITIDPTLDSGSTNPVANSAITNAIDAVSGAIPTTYINSISKDTDLGYERFYRFSTPSNLNYFILRNAKINGRQVLNGGWSTTVNEYNLVETSAITSSVTSASTDSQVPSAKAVYGVATTDEYPIEGVLSAKHFWDNENMGAYTEIGSLNNIKVPNSSLLSNPYISYVFAENEEFMGNTCALVATVTSGSIASVELLNGSSVSSVTATYDNDYIYFTTSASSFSADGLNIVAVMGNDFKPSDVMQLRMEITESAVDCGVISVVGNIPSEYTKDSVKRIYDALSNFEDVNPIAGLMTLKDPDWSSSDQYVGYGVLNYNTYNPLTDSVKSGSTDIIKYSALDFKSESNVLSFNKTVINKERLKSVLPRFTINQFSGGSTSTHTGQLMNGVGGMIIKTNANATQIGNIHISISTSENQSGSIEIRRPMGGDGLEVSLSFNNVSVSKTESTFVKGDSIMLDLRKNFNEIGDYSVTQTFTVDNFGNSDLVTAISFYSISINDDSMVIPIADVAQSVADGKYATKDELAEKANVSDVMTLEKAKENEQVTSYALNNLNNRVTDNTTALGGMKLVKITESEYAALTTKDENTLYIVVADLE